MKTFASFAATGITFIASAAFAPQMSMAADPRTPDQCNTLFQQLNVSGTGKLTAKEAEANSVASKAFSDSSIQKKGYLTQEEFAPLCASDEHEAAKSP